MMDYNESNIITERTVCRGSAVDGTTSMFGGRGPIQATASNRRLQGVVFRPLSSRWLLEVHEKWLHVDCTVLLPQHVLLGSFWTLSPWKWFDSRKKKNKY